MQSSSQLTMSSETEQLFDQAYTELSNDSQYKFLLHLLSEPSSSRREILRNQHAVDPLNLERIAYDFIHTYANLLKKYSSLFANFLEDINLLNLTIATESSLAESNSHTVVPNVHPSNVNQSTVFANSVRHTTTEPEIKKTNQLYPNLFQPAFPAPPVTNKTDKQIVEEILEAFDDLNTGDTITEPYATPHGETYEKSEIEITIATIGNDPYSGAPLTHADLVKNKIFTFLYNYYSAKDVNINVIPDCLKCPLTGQVFVKPVIGEDGWTYERNAFIEYLNMHQGFTPKNERQTKSLEEPELKQKNKKEKQPLYTNRLVERIIKLLGPERTYGNEKISSPNSNQDYKSQPIITETSTTQRFSETDYSLFSPSEKKVIDEFFYIENLSQLLVSWSSNGSKKMEAAAVLTLIEVLRGRVPLMTLQENNEMMFEVKKIPIAFKALEFMKQKPCQQTAKHSLQPPH